MKNPGGLPTVFAQRGEKWGLVTLLYTAQNIKMQVEIIFLLVKNA
jgi:hypothetical protein